MQHTHHSEHLREGGTGPISRIQHDIADLLHGVVSAGVATVKIGGEIGVGTIKIVGGSVGRVVKTLLQ